MAEEPGYVPSLTEEEIALLRAWHEDAYHEIKAMLPARVTHLGVDLVVPEDVFPPAPLLAFGEALLREVRADDRVLDMGTGSGINAILAARVAPEVVAVDVNPLAVETATANAERNGVADRTTFLHGDLFGPVDGRFDLILFDPPFRWFAPRDALEVAMADENYGTLTRFMAEVHRFLADRGRILLFFGTSGDIGYLRTLIERSGFSAEVVGGAQATRVDREATYSVFRLT
jgi:release factor glutamine methyltransferase